MARLGLPGIIDYHLRRHGLQQGLSWGWITTIWLAYILTQSNPRKQPVQAWARQAQDTIERITGMKVKELDFTDDQLTLLLRRLSKAETWQSIETDLRRSIIRVYELKAEKVRLDATTVSGYYASGEETLFQYGHSKDDPSLAQVKVMVAALDPLGLPLVTQVVAGNTADDPLYIPAVDRVLQIIEGVGLLFVGDCKMSALSIRAYIHHLGQHYLCPLAQTGKTGQEMIGWIEATTDGQHPLGTVYVENEQDERRYLAEGYEFECRTQSEIDDEVKQWTECGFHRLKGVPLSLNPLFVKRDDQVVGLTNLLSLAVRFLTLIEFVVRQKLKQNQEKLVGLIENNPQKGIDNPTTERLLKMFDNITFTIVHMLDQNIRHLPALNLVQIRILELLGLPANVYSRLTHN